MLLLSRQRILNIYLGENLQPGLSDHVRGLQVCPATLDVPAYCADTQLTLPDWNGYDVLFAMVCAPQLQLFEMAQLPSPTFVMLEELPHFQVCSWFHLKHPQLPTPTRCLPRLGRNIPSHSPPKPRCPGRESALGREPRPAPRWPRAPRSARPPSRPKPPGAAPRPARCRSAH